MGVYIYVNKALALCNGASVGFVHIYAHFIFPTDMWGASWSFYGLPRASQSVWSFIHTYANVCVFYANIGGFEGLCKAPQASCTHMHISWFFAYRNGGLQGGIHFTQKCSSENDTRCPNLYRNLIFASIPIRRSLNWICCTGNCMKWSHLHRKRFCPISHQHQWMLLHSLHLFHWKWHEISRSAHKTQFCNLHPWGSGGSIHTKKYFTGICIKFLHLDGELIRTNTPDHLRMSIQ